MSTERKCPKCGAERVEGTIEGLCPKCVASLAFATGGEAAPRRAVTTPSSQKTLAISEGDLLTPRAGTKVTYFGEYELLDEIGRGGMGVIYKARQASLNRTVALKMILAGQLASEAEVKRFQTEAEAAAALDHPHIVAIYEVGEHEGQHYFSMQFVEGESLAQRIADCRLRIGDYRASAELMATVARAVHYAHQRGIIHRDLKPANILIDAQGEPHVTDFGLAKRIQEECGLTLSGAVMGTPAYMAPEQAAGKAKHLTTAADVYSLGAILYELLTGKPPFEGETPLEVMHKAVEQEPQRPSTLNRRVDRDLETICLRCLEKEPQRRYGSAEALAEDLQRWLRQEPIRARPVNEWERVVKWARRKPMVAALGAVIVLVAVVGFMGVLWQWRAAQRNAAAETRQRQRAEQAVTRLEIERAESLFGTDDSTKALAYLARLLRQQPTNRIAAERIMNALSQRNFGLPSARPLQHRQRVKAAQFSPDGQTVATGSQDGTARLWDTRTGLRVSEPRPHNAEVTWVQFSPDGKWLVTASLDKTARLWNAVTFEPLNSPLPHDDAVLFADFSPDSRRLLTASRDKTVRFWDVQTGQPLLQPITNRAEVYFARFSPDGSRIVAASRDHSGMARIFDIATGSELGSFIHLERPECPSTFPQFSPDGQRVAVLEAMAVAIWDIRQGQSKIALLHHDDEVTTAEFSPDGKLVATASFDNTARIWNVRTGAAATPPLKHDHWVLQVQFNAEGTRLLTSSRDKSARIWDVRTGKAVVEPLRHEAGVFSAHFSPDGQRVLTITEGNAAWLWDVSSAAKLNRVLPHNAPIRHALFSPDGRAIATACWDDTVKLWEARSGELLTDRFRTGGRVWFTQFNPNGLQVAMTSDGGNQLWDIATRRRVALLGSPSFAGYYLRFSPDGKRIVTAHDDFAWVWDTGSGQLVNKLPHLSAEYAEFASDSTRLVTVGSDHAARLWDAQSGRPISEPLQHEERVYWAEFSPDGQQVVTGSKDKTARIWEVHTGRMLAKLVHADELYLHHSVQFSPDGQCVATAAGNAAQAWNARTGSPIIPPLKHGGSVNSIRFSPDGKRLVTACNDGTARIWDVASGHPLSESLSHRTRVCYAEFSPDGHRVVTASTDGTARVWEVALARVPIPAWLPDLAEALAGQTIDAHEISAAVPVEKFFQLEQRLNDDPGQGYYETWARSSLSKVGPLEGLREAVRLSLTNAVAQMRLASIIAQTAKENPQILAEVEQICEESLKMYPDQMKLWLLKAEWLEAKGGFSGALTVLDQALARQPQQPGTWHAKGCLLAKTNRSADADLAFTKAIDLASADTNRFGDVLIEGWLNRCEVRKRLNRLAEAGQDYCRAKGLPLRNPQAKSNLCDLSLQYNASLQRNWHGDQADNNLAELPVGVHTLAGVEFDLRGMIAVGCYQPGWQTKYPRVVSGISVNQTCQRIHFLQAGIDVAKVKERTRIGQYRVHYADGHEQEIPIVTGQDLADWWSQNERDKPYVAAWTGSNPKARSVNLNVHLFKRTWENPRPNVIIQSFDFESAHDQAFPFLVAITVE